MFKEFYDMTEGERQKASLHLPSASEASLSAEDVAVLSDFRTRYKWNDDDCIGKGANGAVFRVVSLQDLAELRAKEREEPTTHTRDATPKAQRKGSPRTSSALPR